MIRVLDCTAVLAGVDDDATVVGDAERRDFRAQLVDRRELEHQLRRHLRHVVRRREVLFGDETRARNVCRVVVGLGADVQHDQVAVVEVLGQPIAVDDQRRGGLRRHRDGCEHERERQAGGSDGERGGTSVISHGDSPVCVEVRRCWSS